MRAYHRNQHVKRENEADVAQRANKHNVTPTLTPTLAPENVQRALASPATASHADILALQHVAGNRAVSGLLVQAKLVVGPVGDRYEQEADRVAGQVVSGQPSAISGQPSARAAQRQEEEEEVQTKPLAASITPLVQRQAPEEEEEVQTKPAPNIQRQEEEEEVQTKRATEIQRQEEEELQTKPEAEKGFEVGNELESRLAAHKGGGSPLPGDVRAFMEPRFGADFGRVQVHTGGEAAQLNRDLRAQAFTHGQDIYLGAGKYDPGSDGGKRLLAHELTHVIQQTGHVQPRIQRWELSSPLKGQGAHETLTLESLKIVYPEIFKKAQSYKDAEAAWEYIRGALWNDDPTASLFWTRTTRGLGLSFLARFLKGEHSKSSLGPQGSLTGRSHVGDLQFLHGMADPTEKTVDTKAKMMRWAEFTYNVSVGVIAVTAKLGQIPVIAGLFPKQAKWTVAKLFDASSNKSDARHRATGSLLHMMQDTFCESHSARTKDQRDQKVKGKITGFRAYGSQVSSKHGEEDKLVREGLAKNKALKKAARAGQVGDIIANVPGAKQAVDIGATILTFIKDSRPWAGQFSYVDRSTGQTKTYQGVQQYLDQEVFGIEAGYEETYAAPGKQFRKSTKKVLEDFRSKTSRGWLRRREPSLIEIDRLLASFEQLDHPELVGPDIRNAKLKILETLDDKIEAWLTGHPEKQPQKKQGLGAKIGRGLLTVGKVITSPIYVPAKQAFFKDPDTVREVQILRSIIEEMGRDLEDEAEAEK